MRGPLVSSPGMPNHLDEDRTGVLRGSDLAGEIDPSSLDPITRLQSKREAEAIDRGHRCLDRYDPRMGLRQQDHRIDMIGVHVREDAGRGLGQRVRGGLFVVPGPDPAHHAETPDVVEIDGFELEEAEICEVNPVAAILVASEVRLPSGSNLAIRYRHSVSYEGRSGSPKRVAISSRLRNEEAASRVSLQILSVHRHIAYEENGPTCRIRSEEH